MSPSSETLALLQKSNVDTTILTTTGQKYVVRPSQIAFLDNMIELYSLTIGTEKIVIPTTSIMAIWQNNTTVNAANYKTF